MSGVDFKWYRRIVREAWTDFVDKVEYASLVYSGCRIDDFISIALECCEKNIKVCKKESTLASLNDSRLKLLDAREECRNMLFKLAAMSRDKYGEVL